MATRNDEDIRVRAYYLWESDGRPAGRDLEFWRLAQQSLGTSEQQHLEEQTKNARRPKTSASPSAAGRQRKPAKQSTGVGIRSKKASPPQ